MGKQKAPAFQFYADKWLAGTMHLQAKAYKAYHRVLCWMWLHDDAQCGISDDEVAICNASGLGRRAYKSVWVGQVMNKHHPLLKREGNRLISEGLRKEAQKQAVYRESRRAGAYAMHKQRRKPARAMHQGCSSTPSPSSLSPSPKEGERRGEPDAAAAVSKRPRRPAKGKAPEADPGDNHLAPKLVAWLREIDSHAKGPELKYQHDNLGEVETYRTFEYVEIYTPGPSNLMMASDSIFLAHRHKFRLDGKQVFEKEQKA